MNRSKQSEKKWNFYAKAYEKQEKSENFDNNGFATLKTRTEDKETEFDRDFLREDKEDHEEANDVKKREEETSFASDTVEKPTVKNLRDCEHMIDKTEAKKCENNEISKIEPSELIAEVKKKDSAQKNERKTKKNDGELDDYDEEAKIDDEDHACNKWTQLNDEMTDLDDSFLDSGQFDNKKEDGASKTRREVEATIENDVETKVTEFEAEKHENEENYEFGREIERERRATMHDTIDYDEEKKDSERSMENNAELIEICDFEVGDKDGNCRTYEKGKKLTVDATEVQKSMLCAIFVKLTTEKMRSKWKQNRKQFKVDDDCHNEKVNLETKFLE